MTVGELRVAIEAMPDDTIVALCVDEFPYTAIDSPVIYEIPSEYGPGSLLFRLKSDTELAEFLEQGSQ